MTRNLVDAVNEKRVLNGFKPIDFSVARTLYREDEVDNKIDRINTILYSNNYSKQTKIKALAMYIVLKYKRRYGEKAAIVLKENLYRETIMTMLDTKENMLHELEQNKSEIVESHFFYCCLVKKLSISFPQFSVLSS
ncbi:hypothetical protein [Succinivibrio dextrinosolvens]|uniref:hypothetical protein n=1 Tax=Succinivibrio dextrinosolvens TaxID=83771 RepID=UPI00241F9E13|nr:hypothetical protein [Succinivibrio dextrinosolvens]MBE6422866.1 hypothetical protein [Succinivibrio dextrinosolvens]